MAEHLAPDCRLIWSESIAGKLEKDLCRFVDKVTARPLEPLRFEPSPNGSGNESDEIEIAGCVRPAGQKLNRGTADEYRNPVATAKKALDPCRDRRRSSRSFGQRERFFEFHDHNLYVVGNLVNERRTWRRHRVRNRKRFTFTCADVCPSCESALRVKPKISVHIVGQLHRRLSYPP
jgi:hypothetical protein